MLNDHSGIFSLSLYNAHMLPKFTTIKVRKNDERCTCKRLSLTSKFTDFNVRGKSDEIYASNFKSSFSQKLPNPSRMGNKVIKPTDEEIQSYKFPEFDEPMEHEEIEQSTFRNKRDTHTIFYRVWKPKATSPVGIILGMHGILEHSGKYALAAHAWTKKGFVVVFADHEGHGKTVGGIRGDYEEISHVVDDNYQLLFSHIVPAYPSGTPLFLFGHSMGSIVCGLLTKKIEIEGKKLAGSILSGCALIVGPAAFRPLGIPALYAISGTSLSDSLGTFLKAHDPVSPSSEIVMAALIADPERLEQNKKDILMQHEPVKNRAGFNTIIGAKELIEYAPNFTTPILLFHGEHDQACLPSGSVRMYANLKQSPNKKLMILPNELHEVLYDKNASVHLVPITEWIMDRLK